MGEIRNKDGLTEEEFLKQYKPSKYERPSVTVDMLILCMSRYLDNLKVLLIQRKIIHILTAGLWREDL